MTVNEIASLVRGRVHGDGNVVIDGVAGLDDAKPGDLSFLRDPKKAKAMESLKTTRAAAVIVPSGVSANGKTFIEVENANVAFAAVLQVIAQEKSEKHRGVHPLANVSKSAKIGKDVTIGAFTIVEDDAVIGDGCHLMGQVYIGARSKVGSGTWIYPQVVVREDISIGDRCIIHSGAVIGSDGYGFFFASGIHNKIPQIGTVVIEDDVEIGSNTTIDRATIGATIIRRGTKIDNLVQIAHNVEVGENSLLVAQAGIAGSSKIGKGVVLAGQVGVADHVSIGDGTQVGAQSGINRDLEPGSVFFGTPAQPLQETLKQVSLVRRLPELFRDVKNLKDKARPDESPS